MALLSLLAMSSCLQPLSVPGGDGGDSGGAGGGSSAGSGGIPGRKLCLALQPQGVDFGNVVVNTTASGSVNVSNCGSVPETVTLGSWKGTDPLLFNSDPPSGTSFLLNAAEMRPVRVLYAPLVASSVAAEAYFAVSVCSSGAGCELLVKVRGLAVATGLSVVPPALDFDFGFVPPGRSVTELRSVALSNVGNVPIHLTADPLVVNAIGDGGTSSAGPFQLGAGFPTKGATIPPGASTEIAVVFMGSGFHTGELDIATDDRVNSSVRVPLTTGAQSRGATISCSPVSLDFGVNAVVGGVGIASTLSVLCTNIGESVPGHPEANLFIPDPSSSAPGLSIENGDPAFAAAFAQPFPLSGLAGGQGTTIEVTYAPTTQGTDTDTLIISSNDVLNPQTRIALTGSAEVLPPCDFLINPTNGLAFGHVDVGDSVMLPFDVVNNGADQCVLSDPQMSASSDPAFSLVDYPPGVAKSRTVPAGASLPILVQFTPPVARASFSGSVDFTVLDVENPREGVNLTGSSLPGCLAISPNPANLGFAKVAQSPPASTEQTITIQNICGTQDVVVDSISVVDLSTWNGRPAPQFAVTKDPSPVLLHNGPTICTNCGLAHTTLDVTFTPRQTGFQIAGLKIFTNDLQDPYLVELIGYGEQ